MEYLFFTKCVIFKIKTKFIILPFGFVMYEDLNIHFALDVCSHKKYRRLSYIVNINNINDHYIL